MWPRFARQKYIFSLYTIYQSCHYQSCHEPVMLLMLHAVSLDHLSMKIVRTIVNENSSKGGEGITIK